MKRMILGVGAMLMGLLLVAGLVSAEIPHLINFQGRLTDASGNPLNSNYNITFSIYSVPSGGTALWTETQTGVTVSNGIFNVLLGSVTEISATIFEEKDRFLGIKVGTDPEMIPRQRITSVGYAFNADRVKGSNIFPSSGNVGIGTTSPIYPLDVTGHGRFKKTDGYGELTVDGTGDSNHYAGLSLRRVSDGKKWTIDYRNLTEGNNDLIIGYNDAGATGWHTWMLINDANGNVGIGTTSPSEKLEVNGTVKATSFEGGGVAKVYRSEWFPVTINSTYVKAHGLETYPDIVQVFLAQNSDGSGWCIVSNGIGDHHCDQCRMVVLSATQIKIRTLGALSRVYDENGTERVPTSGYCRIVAIKY